MGSESQTSWSPRTILLMILAAGGLTIGAFALTGALTFNAATAPAGVSSKTKMWHDSTTDTLMVNSANGGAKYVVTDSDLSDGKLKYLRAQAALAGQ